MSTALHLVDESIRPTPRSRRFGVAGMTCGHCEHAVQQEVGRLPGVRHVVADAAAGTVIVESVGDVDLELLAAAVDEAGYRLAG